jgi:hypothetical protein
MAPTVPRAKVFKDEAEAAATEELIRVTAREAAEAKQREAKDEQWAVYQVCAYEEFQREAAIRRVKIERVELD